MNMKSATQTETPSLAQTPYVERRNVKTCACCGAEHAKYHHDPQYVNIVADVRYVELRKRNECQVCTEGIELLWEDSHCRVCDEPTINDGEGFDGMCGRCADKAEIEENSGECNCDEDSWHGPGHQTACPLFDACECECEQLMHDKEFAGRHHDECPMTANIKVIDGKPHCELGQHFWVKAGEECNICHRVINRDANGREIVEPEPVKSVKRPRLVCINCDQKITDKEFMREANGDSHICCPAPKSKRLCLLA